MNKQLIESCRYVGRCLGEESAQELTRHRIDGSFAKNQNGLFYRDEKISIGVCPTDLTLVVERLENNNPVIVIKPNGQYLRFHGEAYYLEDHINQIIQTQVLK